MSSKIHNALNVGRTPDPPSMKVAVRYLGSQEMAHMYTMPMGDGMIVFGELLYVPYPLGTRGPFAVRLPYWVTRIQTDPKNRVPGLVAYLEISPACIFPLGQSPQGIPIRRLT